MMWRLTVLGIRFIACAVVLTMVGLSAGANPALAGPASADLGELAGLDETIPAFPENPPVLQGGVVETDYILGTGDVVNINDETMEELANGARILSDGTITLPLLGKVHLSGMSLNQAQVFLNEQYKKYFVNPDVTVAIQAARPIRVYVTGAVSNPGIYISGKSMASSNGGSVTLGDANVMSMYYRMYVSDALMLAGGLKFNANVHDVIIRRTYPKPQVIHVNLMDLFANANTIQDLPLNDKDVVVIQELPKEQVVMDEQWQTLSRSNLVEDKFRINVLGAVGNPGVYEVKSNDTAISAIASAGGFSNVADQDAVYILRSNSTGQVFKRKLNLKDKQVLGGQDLQEYAMLLPNDIVFVDESVARKGKILARDMFSRSSNAGIFLLLNRLFTGD